VSTLTTDYSHLTPSHAFKPRVSLEQFRAAQAVAKDAMSSSAIPYSPSTGLDAFNNALARIGFGTNNLLESTAYPLTRLSYNWYLLISLYRDNWLVSKMIDAVAEAMVSKWISFPTETNPGKVKKLEQCFTLHGVQDQILSALKWARLFGGSGALMIVKNSGKLDTPLIPDDVPLDSFRGLIVFDRWSGIQPSSKVSADLDFPLDYGLPETYRINTERGGGFEVHSSRILRFTGRIMPAWEFQADQRWGVSEVERAFQELKKRDNTSYNLASLIFRANIFELRQKGLAQMISGLNANAQAQAQFAATIQAQAQLISNQGIVVSDSESGGLSTHQYGFAGIAEVYALFQRDWCACSEIPYSIMFGHEGGLGQNGDADENTYYDRIGQRQKREVDPQFRKLVPVVAMSTWGKVPADLEWTWNPVNNPSDKQKAELAGVNTTAVMAAFNSGVISQKTAAQELKQQSSVTNLFTNITNEQLDKMSDEAMGGEMQESALMPEESNDEKSDAKPDRKKAKTKTAKDAFPHDLRHPDTGRFSKALLRHQKFAGLDVVIENEVGHTRSGDGWSVTMKHPYGYIARTEGADGDEVDVFLGPNEKAEKCYVIHTRNAETGDYDEDKLFVGFADSDAAVAAFYDNYSDAQLHLGGIEMVTMTDLKDKLAKFRGRKIEAYA
jgi:phage-related protein (TIGR01555 family)